MAPTSAARTCPAPAGAAFTAGVACVTGVGVVVVVVVVVIVPFLSQLPHRVNANATPSLRPSCLAEARARHTTQSKAQQPRSGGATQSPAPAPSDCRATVP